MATFGKQVDVLSRKVPMTAMTRKYLVLESVVQIVT